MNLKNFIKYGLTVIVIGIIIIFFYFEINKNYSALKNYQFNINFIYLITAFIFLSASFLLETYIWQICINHYIDKKLTFFESVAVVNTSNLFKYIPGRIWAYTAQLTIMAKKNISKTLIIYVNIICLASSIIVSTNFGILYLLYYMKLFSVLLSTLIFTGIIILDIIFITMNVKIFNILIFYINKLFKRRIPQINIKKGLLLLVQLLYLISWFLAGLSGYILLISINLTLQISLILAIVASMSVSWIVGYLTFISPGGLGIREGLMFIMLKNISNFNISLLLPIITRLMYIFIEIMLGLTGLVIGYKNKFFELKK